MPHPPHRWPGRPVAWGRLSKAMVSLSAALLALVLGTASGQVSAADTASGTLVVTAADDGRVVNLRRGELLRVVLADTAGTGYSWEIEHNDPKLLAPEGQQTWQDPGPPAASGSQVKSPGLVGGPLQVSFQFRVVGKGNGELRLRHWRPWEGPRSINRRFKLALRVVG